MDNMQPVSMPDGTTIWIPSTTLFRVDEPTPVPCTHCGATVRAEKASDVPWEGRYYWRWQYCECMARAAAYARESADAAERAAETQQAFDLRQRDYFQLFPQWQQSARVPDERFDTFRQGPGNQGAYREAERWVTAWPKTGLLLRGNTGTGKTHLIRAIGHVALAQHKHLLYTSVPFLLERLRPNSGVSMDAVMDLHLKAELVIWDDVGAEKETEWTLDRLYLLLDARYEANKPLLATSNYTLKELETQLGARITSRLLEMCAVWEVKGPDERVARARQRVTQIGGVQ